MRMAPSKPGSVKPVSPRPKGTMGDDVGGYNRPGAPKPSKPRKPGGKPDMPIGLPTPKKPVRVKKVDVRGVDGKPIKEQKPVLFGMAKGGAVKKGKK